MSRTILDRDVTSAQRGWEGFLDLAGVREACAELNPQISTIGYKFPHPEMSEHDAALGAFREPHDKIYTGTVDRRYITTIRKAAQVRGVRFVKLVQNRPGRSDPSGLEHIDVQISEKANLKPLRSVLDTLRIHYAQESNEGHRWFSVSLEDREFPIREIKFIDHSLWDVIVWEMQED